MSNGDGAAPVQKAYFPYLNRAVLEIDGSQYYEWESVSVRAALMEIPRTFRFTASEKEIPPSRSAMRIKPGQKCSVYLDGYPVIENGDVVTRQVFYSSNQHVVEIQGQGKAGKMIGSSVVSQTGEFNNIGLKELVQTLGARFNVGVEGTAGSFMKFPRVSAAPGSSPWEVIEPHARASQTVMSESAQGNIKFGVAMGGASVIEGWNILEGREVIHSLVATGSGAAPGGVAPGAGEGSDYLTIGQRPGTDDSHGPDANQVNSEKPAITTDLNTSDMPKTSLSEVPAWMKQMADNRSMFEAMTSDSLQYWVNIVLLTWQRSGKAPPSGGLWEPGDMVVVNSPMLILNGQALRLKAVTWSQDNESGTRSHIELVNEKAMTSAVVPGGKPPKTQPELPSPTGEQQPEELQRPPSDVTITPSRRTWSRRR